MTREYFFCLPFFEICVIVTFIAVLNIGIVTSPIPPVWIDKTIANFIVKLQCNDRVADTQTKWNLRDHFCSIDVDLDDLLSIIVSRLYWRQFLSFKLITEYHLHASKLLLKLAKVYPRWMFSISSKKQKLFYLLTTLFTPLCIWFQVPRKTWLAKI